MWAEAYAASRKRLKVLIDKGVADAFAANPAAQQRLTDGLSSSTHQAIIDVLRSRRTKTSGAASRHRQVRKARNGSASSTALLAKRPGEELHLAVERLHPLQGEALRVHLMKCATQDSPTLSRAELSAQRPPPPSPTRRKSKSKDFLNALARAGAARNPLQPPAPLETSGG